MFIINRYRGVITIIIANNIYILKIRGGIAMKNKDRQNENIEDLTGISYLENIDSFIFWNNNIKQVKYKAIFFTSYILDKRKTY